MTAKCETNVSIYVSTQYCPCLKPKLVASFFHEIEYCC